MKTENTKNAIIAMLNDGSNIATIEYKTAVKTAAKYKDVKKIEKTSRANVMLFKSLKEYTDVYLNAVKKTASKIESNDAQNVDNFEKSDSYFIHDRSCHSIAYHKANSMPYLFAIFNKSLGSIYTVDGIECDRLTVAQYLTPSEAKKLLGDNSLTYNVKNDVIHAVIVRTIKLENIISVNANKAKIEFKTALAA